MKKGTILISLFAIMLFAGIASAQNGRIYIVTDAGVFIPAVQSGDIPTLTLSAGQPIKIRIMGPSGTGKTMSAAVLPALVRMQIPCEPSGGAAGEEQQYALVKKRNIYVLDTENAWRGSCHLLSIRLGNNAAYRAKVRFQ